MARSGNPFVAMSAIDIPVAVAATSAPMADDEGPQSRVGEIMRARGLRQAELGRLTGMQPPTLGKIVKGQRGVTPNFRQQLADALSVPPGSLYEPVGSPIPELAFAAGSDVQPLLVRQSMEARRLPLTAQAPIMGTVSCGSDGQFEVNLSGDALEYADLPPKLVGVPGIYGLFVAGESMAGIWAPGDVVWVSKNRPVTPGAYVVVLVEERKGHPPGAYLKQFVRRDNDQLILKQMNPDMERIIWNGHVRQMHRALHWREWI
jgi:SOS-response transcriptional repressor LexA